MVTIPILPVDTTLTEGKNDRKNDNNSSAGDGLAVLVPILPLSRGLIRLFLKARLNTQVGYRNLVDDYKGELGF
ncbi:MAG: hypothetical protein AUI97_00770 [Crenarchaeota archaeon 13_1_40CM_3_52_17]|nr:MAG: hypothetical protein AUI97_00770 [Crenarchaeota archaeon 13_1_40CM_3_52_17]